MKRNHRFEHEGIKFRINRTAPLIIVKASLNGKGPFDFIVDTGASMTVISPAVAKRAGVNAKGVKAKATGAHGHIDATIGRLKSMKIGDTEASGLSVAIMSLAIVNRATNLKLGGVIGYNLLKRYVVTIDYSKRRIFFKAAQSPKARRSKRSSERKR